MVVVVVVVVIVIVLVPLIEHRSHTVGYEWRFFIFCWRCISLQIIANKQLTHFFIYLFISSLYMFRASQCSSSGDRIILIHHLVWLVCVSDCLVCRSGTKLTQFFLYLFIYLFHLSTCLEDYSVYHQEIEFY